MLKLDTPLFNKILEKLCPHLILLVSTLKESTLISYKNLFYRPRNKSAYFSLLKKLNKYPKKM